MEKTQQPGVSITCAKMCSMKHALSAAFASATHKDTILGCVQSAMLINLLSLHLCFVLLPSAIKIQRSDGIQEA